MEKKQINLEKTSLGIEFGSTRIKAVLIDLNDYSPLASGSHDWENRFENGFWTYHIDDVWAGLQDCYSKLAQDVKNKFGTELTCTGAIGISAMMHGYMPFNKAGNLLVPFRTWRNTTTEKASVILTEKLGFNIPQRWSAAHLFQAILNKEAHVKEIDFLTTLAGFVHWKLTGKKVLGIDDASGMFPVSMKRENGEGRREIFYDKDMIEKFNNLVVEHGYNFNIENILPKVLLAGEEAGVLTEEGALLLDPGRKLKAGIPFCPPEGDAGTGMTATNAVAERTGNVSAGTSVFAMIVTEKPLSKVYPEIDIVATPAGKTAAMVHCNNCTGDIDAWFMLFKETLEFFGAKADKPALYDALYNKALEAEEDCGGLLAYNYISGEQLTGLEHGRPLLVRLPDSNFNLSNLMRTLIFSSIATLKIGMDILLKEEKVKIENLLGHGGLFKTKGIAQRYMAAALNIPVSVEESAGEGGAWGIALLAAYTLQANGELKIENGKLSLEDFLNNRVFSGKDCKKINPDPKDAESFAKFFKRYKAGLEIEQSAVSNI